MSRHLEEVATSILHLEEVATLILHLEEVATSTLHQKRSRHQHCIRSGRDISLQRNQGRDINQRSRYQWTRKEVATSFNSRDIMSKREEVATTPSCCDIIKQSRQQKQGKEVATSYSSRDIKYKELRSRHH